MKVKDKRLHRKIRIRKKISGTSAVPRLAVFKSNNNIYVQAIDDLNQVTVASASTLSKEIKSKNLSNESAKEVGELLGSKLKDLKIKSPYNTYLNYGLPPGPINSPGLESIKAALYPEKVDFLFFVAKGDGYHTFSRTEKEHNKAKRAFQKVRRQNKLKKKADKS